MSETLADTQPNSIKQHWSRFLFLTGLITIAAVSRLLPHPLNFTPLGAMALFGGAMLGSRMLSAFIPLAALFLGDIFLGFHSLMPAVYGCFLFYVVLGWWLQKRTKPLPIFGAAVLGSVVFFIVTNFANWLVYYDNTLVGLTACYVAAIPYYQNTLAGDLFFSAIMFGSLALSESKFPALRLQAQSATTS